jgi:peptidoglycan/LPS O-acetylase OafA/YrhL
MAERKTYLGRVQVLRFVAATAVLFAHLQHEVQERLMPDAPFHPFTAIDGGVGVDLFFVISGFIMYHVSADKFAKPGGSGDFLLRRFLRVAPLYYLATLLMLAATHAVGSAVSIDRPDIANIVASFLFLPALNEEGIVAPVLKLGWTLNYEVYFYAVFAVAIALPRRVGLIALTLVLGAVVAAAALLPHPPLVIAFWGQPIVFEFLGGILVAILFRRGLRLTAVHSWLLIGGGVALLVALRLSGLSAHVDRAVFGGVPAWMIVLGVVVGPFDHQRGRLQKLLEAGGEASYAIYVLHPFGIRAATLAWQRLGGPQQPWVFITLVLAVVILGAYAVHVMIERPIDQRLRALLVRRASPAQRAAMPKG